MEFRLLLPLLGMAASKPQNFHGTIADRVLTGYEFQSAVVQNYEQCYRLCLYSKPCKSVNWYPRIRVCEMNSEALAAMTFSQGNLHVSIQKIEFVKDNACNPNPCDVGQTCLPILAAKSQICSECLTSGSTPSSDTAPTTTSTTIATNTIIPTTSSTDTAPTTTSTTMATTANTMTTKSTTMVTTNNITITSTTMATTANTITTISTTMATTANTIATTANNMTTTTNSITTSADCSQLSDQFSDMPNHAIAGNNIASYTDLDYSECKQRCLVSVPICRSFDYTLGGVGCWLANVTRHDVHPADFVYREVHGYSERLSVCEV